MCVGLSFPYRKDLWVWEATSSALWTSFRQQGERGLRNYAAPILFFLRPVPTLWVSPSERFSSVSGAQGQLIGCKLLYCDTQSFQKESVGPHLGNRDVNTYKRCLNLELYKYWSFYPFSFSVVFCMLLFFFFFL